METVPKFVLLLFAATTLLTIWLFYKAANESKKLLLLITTWMVIISALGIAGFYLNTEAIPPRMFLLIGPPFLLILILPFTSRGKIFIESLSLSRLTLLHTIRIPVEITLFYVALSGLIPEIMTFEGNNIDIISGISAPVMYFLVFKYKNIGMKSLLIWNYICIALLLNILIIAILAAPTPFQQIAFDSPNNAVTYFPFIWLPGLIVPVVLFSHVAAIIRIRAQLKDQSRIAD